MQLTIDDCRRLAVLLSHEAHGRISSAEEDELRQLVAREEPNATMLEWPELTQMGHMLVRSRGPLG